VFSVSHYVPLHSSPGGHKFARSSGSFKVTDAISDRLLRLPLYFGITDAEVDAVIDAVKAFYSKRANARA
jgi:dTDP-4-amino-4,6-dideoxygalactose transaminase